MDTIITIIYPPRGDIIDLKRRKNCAFYSWKSPMYSTAIGMWVIRIMGAGHPIGDGNRMGIAGVWLSIAIDLYLRAIYLFYRFKKRSTVTK